MHQLTYMSSSISFCRGVKKKQKHSLVLNDGDVLCNVPLNILASKLTLKTAKELANLHDMYQTRRDDSRCSPSSLQHLGMSGTPGIAY